MRLCGVLFCGVAFGAMLSVPAALADTMTFTATLAGTNEVPANGSPGTGSATVLLNGNTLTVTETFSGLTAPATAGHIHCCAPVGTNAPVAVPFAGFPNLTAGTYTNTFDLSTFIFSGGLTEASFLAGLESDQAYVNIHDVNFPGGEIEGQLIASTPEPASLLLLGSGMAGLVGLVRRRQRVALR